MVGNPHGGKPGSHGSKAILLSHVYGVVITIASLSPQQLNNSVAGLSNTLNYRVGPHPACRIKCLMCQSTE